MRSNSPYPVRNSPYVRTRSYSRDSAATSPLPVSTSPFTDAPPFSFPAPSCSPYPRLSRPPSESGLDGLIERTQECSSEEESEPLLGSEDSVTAVYGRRWYLLLLFSSAALMETMSWAMWGPIAESAKAVFSWQDSQITMCIFLGNLSFGLCCIPFSWLMDHKGLRVSMVLSCFCIMAGAGLRCLIRFVPSNYYIWCIYGGQMLNGVAGPVAQGGGALFSNLWFPNNQRATSTAISTFIGYTGNALAFVVGPFLVPSPTNGPGPNNDNNTLPHGNDTEWTLVQKMSQDSGNSSGGPTDTTVMMDAVLDYLDYQAAAAAGLLVLVLVYFPDRPPRPPSLSAATEREDFGPGLAKLLKNRQFWLISAAFCLSMGVFEVWDVVLDVNLSTIGISQDTAGWLGFYCVMAGCLTGLLICRLADFFFRQIRLFLILSYVVSAVFVLWFTLIYIGVLPLDIVSIYAAIILSGVFLDGCSPLVYELICEAAYPVGEGVSSCFLQMLFVLVGMAFAAVQNVPNIGTEWMNWCLLGTLCVAIPLLFCVTDIYGRADLDKVEQQVTVVNPPHNPSTQQDHAEKEPLLLPRHTHPPPPHCPSPIPRPQSGGYGTCTPAFSPTYHYHSARPTSEPFHKMARHSQGDSNSSLHVPDIKFTVKREQHKPPSNNRGGAASIRRNASYQGLDDGEVESEQLDLFGESGRGDVTSSAPSDSVDRGCMFNWDRSSSESCSSSVSQADRRIVDSAQGPTARYLLTSGQHSVDLSFLQLS